MIQLKIVNESGELIGKREFYSATECCNDFVKALNHYTSKGEKMEIRMEQENKLIINEYTWKTN
jgi:hypothetical protein